MKKSIILFAMLGGAFFASADLIREETFNPLPGVVMRPIAGERLTLPSFDGATAAFELGARRVSVTGNAVYPARRVGSPWNDSSLVTTSSGFILRTKAANGHRLAYVWNGSVVRVRENSVACRGKCGTCAAANGSAGATVSSSSAVGRAARNAVVSDEPLTGDPLKDGYRMLKGEKVTNVVDVLIVLDKSAQKWVEEKSDFAGLDDPCAAYADDAILRANQTLANTGLTNHFTFALARLVKINCDCGAVRDSQDDVDSTKLLTEAIQQTGRQKAYWRQVAAAREESHADVVSIHVACGDDVPTGTVGIGNALANDSITYSNFPDMAYNVCLIESVAYTTTMAHEIGHNMGAGHAKMADEGNSGPQLYDYSTGYYFNATNAVDGVFRHCATVMAYDDDGYAAAGRWGDQIPEWLSDDEKSKWARGMFIETDFFSSPDYTYKYVDANGQLVVTDIPLGDALHDNTRLLSLTYPLVANYRAREGGARLMLDYPGEGNSGKSTVMVPFTLGKTAAIRAVAKKGFVFAGWYRAYDDLTGAFAEPYVSAAGGDFRSASTTYKFAADEVDEVTLYGRFVKLGEDIAAVALDEIGECVAGQAIEPIAIDVSGCTSAPKVTVSGLPKGLAFNEKRFEITGAPAKSGVYNIEVSVRTAGGKTAIASAKLVVRAAGQMLLDVDWDTSAGTVTGAGVYAANKTVTVKAKAKKGYVFAGFYCDSELLSTAASAKITLDGDKFLTAEFVTLEEEYYGVSVLFDGEEIFPEETCAISLACGVYTALPVVESGYTANTITASGLPAGLKLKNGMIFGVPTKASKINYTTETAIPTIAKITVKTAGGQKLVYPLAITVEAIPDHVLGSFNGELTAYTEAASNNVGIVSLDVKSSGKISGKISRPDGSELSFSAASFSARAESCYYFDLIATNKKTKETLSLEGVIFPDDVVGGRLEAYPMPDDDDESAADAPLYIITGQQNRWGIDLDDNGYADLGAYVFTDESGRAKSRTFSNTTTNVVVLGLLPDESLTMQISQSGQIAATLSTKNAVGNAYASTCSAILTPISETGSTPLTATAFLMFKSNPRQDFDGRFLSVVFAEIYAPGEEPPQAVGSRQ